MSKSMAEVIREELRKGSYQMPGDKLPYETQATNITRALNAAGFGNVREAAAAGVYALENAAGANGRVTIKSLEAINAASDMLKGKWDSLIKCEMDFHPRRLPARAERGKR